MKTHIRIPGYTITRCGKQIDQETEVVEEQYEALLSTCKNCQKASTRYRSLAKTQAYFKETGEKWPRSGSPIKTLQ